jgi:protein SCO1/2
MESRYPCPRHAESGSSFARIAALLALAAAAAAANPGKVPPVPPAAPAATGAADTAPGKSAGIRSLKDLRSLRDQEGRPFTFAGLGKSTVLVNFIFTSCPMKCPAQTQALAGLHRALAPDLRSRVRFVSVTVDPERDSSSVLKRYATALGADVPGWFFVTGTRSELDWLYRYFSVGVRAIADGEYDHQMGAYLLDAKGRVMQRYTGDIDKPRLLREIRAVDALGR